MPSPSQPPGTTPTHQTTFGSLIHSIFAGVWREASTSPWTASVLSLATCCLAISVYRQFRWLALTSAPCDPVRRLTSGELAQVLALAGHRCEHRVGLFPRCRSVADLHVDHVHPHSRGGSTTIGNSQVLCSRHNRHKGARIPYNWQLRSLERRRRSYFPAGVRGAVVRRKF